MFRLSIATLLILGCASQAAFAGTTESFDESVNYAPAFSVSQEDPSLSDLFNPANGKSSLCVPTTLANIVGYQAMGRTPGFSSLRLVQSPDQTTYSQQVRFFAQHCGTNPANGTVVTNAVNCMRQFYRDSGYPTGWVYLIGREESADPQSVAFWHGLRPLSIDDLRYYVWNQVGVLMDVYWEQQQQIPGSLGGVGPWVQKGGHTFMIAGYDYDFAWGQNQIHLKVVNPESTYTSGDPSTHFDDVTMTSVLATPGVSFPPTFNYVLSGKGFPTGNVRGYVRNIMVFLPDLSVIPAAQ